MTGFDTAAAALMLVFAYSGYRRGLLTFVLHLTGGVLAFGLAAALTPIVTPLIVRRLDLPLGIAQPGTIVAVTLTLRGLFGFAVRELAACLRVVLRAVPPLAWADHMLGVAPGLALGGIVVIAIALVALTLSLPPGAHDAVASSWLVRNVLTHPDETLATVRRAWNRLMLSPNPLDALPLAVGTGGLWLGAFAARRFRGQAVVERWDDAPTRRMVAPAAAEDDVDAMALPRAALGVSAAGAVVAALYLLGRLRA